MRALVVENDETIAFLNKRFLEMEGFDVDLALTAGDGSRLARERAYDVVVLDMMLPDGSGLSVLEVVRERGRTTPVLVVSGVDDVATTVAALDAGADDFLHKPPEPDELRARVRALLRRGQTLESRIECGNVLLNRMERVATVNNVPLTLTATEFALLECFLLHVGRTLTRAALLKHVWHVDFNPGTNMVDVTVARLRAKLVERGASCRLGAERGVGYLLTPDG